MLQKRIACIITLVLGVISFGCLTGYFLALHDIYHDYASPETWRSENLHIPEWLPEWRSCPGEWRLVGFGYWPMFVFHLVFFVTAALVIVDWYKESRGNSAVSRHER